MTARAQQVLWWGRGDRDYSRNRILRHALHVLGWELADFRPLASKLGDVEARLRRVETPALVWVPCFRQRDIHAAWRWSRRLDVPLLFDPLISQFDKQVSERGKFAAGGHAATRLLRRERRMFHCADLVLADTEAHARFYAETFAVDAAKIHVVHVGAEESLFHPAEPAAASHRPLRVLFFGSFIGLQAPQVIVEAARRYTGPAVVWELLGAGPLRAECERRARGIPGVEFYDPVPYTSLAERIRSADLLLGVFGTSAKAGRVIPNKVFQAMACAKPVVTCRAPAYPHALSQTTDSGVFWTPPGDAQALADMVATLAADSGRLPEHGRRARASYEHYFGEAAIQGELERALAAGLAGRTDQSGTRTIPMP